MLLVEQLLMGPGGPVVIPPQRLFMWGTVDAYKQIASTSGRGYWAPIQSPGGYNPANTSGWTNIDATRSNSFGINAGRLFRGIKNNKEITTSLNKAQINKIFKKLALKADVDKEIIKKISGHSTRVGAAQNLLRSGANLATILNKGRWTKIDTAMRYLEFSSEKIESIKI